MRLARACAAAATATLFALATIGLTAVPASADDAPAQQPAGGAVSQEATLTQGLSDEFSALKTKGQKIGVIAMLDVPAATGKAAGKQAAKRSIAAARAAVLNDLPTQHATVTTTYANLPAISLEVDAEGLAALAANDSVSKVQPNNTVTLSMVTANNLTGATQVINTSGYRGAGSTVAIIDTGVDKTGSAIHPGIADDVVGQACFHEGSGCSSPTDAKDVDGHGTHVAGMITGPNGVAPDAEIYPIKVFDGSGSTTDGAILDGLDHVIGLNAATPGTINEINMSLGGDFFATAESCNTANPAYLQAFQSLTAQGVSIFVATGNEEYVDGIGAPACVDGAIGVGSVDTTPGASGSYCWEDSNVGTDQVSCFSNATPIQGPGELVDIVAPGCSIVSLGLYSAANAVNCGTSMASPYAAGVGAIATEIAAANGLTLTPAQLEDLLESTGVQVTDPRLPTSAPTFPRVSPPAILQALSLTAPVLNSPDTSSPMTADLSWSTVFGATGYSVTVTSQTSGESVEHPATGTSLTVPIGCGPQAITVRAIDSDGIPSLRSNEQVFEVRYCPATVAGVAITTTAQYSHTIAWSAPSAPVDALVVQRRPLNGQWSDVATVAGTATSFADTVASCGRADYRVFAQASNGDRSAASDVVGRGVCAPANDDVSAATTIEMGLTSPATHDVIEANAMWATTALTDPNPSCRQGPAANTQWYRFTATSTGAVNVHTTSAEASSISDPILAAYAGTPSAANEVACGDDQGDSYDADIVFDVQAGETYYVMAGNWSDVGGDSASIQRVTFGWINDEFSTASTLTGSSFTSTIGAARHASTDMNDPAHACGLPVTNGSGSLWWRYTAPVTGTLSLTTAGSAGRYSDTLLSVYSGSPGALTSIACNRDASIGVTTSALGAVALQAGQTYTIVVAAFPPGSAATLNDVVRLAGTFTAGAGTTPEDPTVNPPVTPPTSGVTVIYKAGIKVAKKSVKPTKKARSVRVKVRNLGSAAARLSVKASKAPRGYKIVYRNAKGKNITKKVLAGKYRTANLKAGATATITVTITLKSKKKAKKAKVTLRVAPTAKPAAVATATVKVRR